MKETQDSLIQFLDKAFELTTLALKLVQKKEYNQLNEVLENRARAINIVESLSERLSLYQKNVDPKVYEAFNNQISQIINRIGNMDDIITQCLEHEKSQTQFEIAKTFKNKESFKGYNLNNLK